MARGFKVPTLKHWLFLHVILLHLSNISSLKKGSNCPITQTGPGSRCDQGAWEFHQPAVILVKDMAGFGLTGNNGCRCLDTSHTHTLVGCITFYHQLATYTSHCLLLQHSASNVNLYISHYRTTIFFLFHASFSSGCFHRLQGSVLYVGKNVQSLNPLYMHT